MTLTRRQFLQRSGMAAAGSILVPDLFGSVLVRQALASTIGDRYLVVINLDGGNDGLNTVVPVDDGGGSLRNDYDAARANINLTPSQLAGTLIGADPNTGAQLALHPAFAGSGGGMGGFKALWDLGKLAVIQGCGYPSYSLSHDSSRIVWQTANPLASGSSAGTGWVGDFLADPSQMYGGADIPGVNIGDAVVGEFKQNATSVLALRHLHDFDFPYDAISAADVAAKRAAFAALFQQAAQTAEPAFSYIGNSGVATLLSTESYPPLHGLYESDRATESGWYDGGYRIASDLREVAKIIYGVATNQANVAARFFQITKGGYDTHSNQGGATGLQHDLHKAVGDAVRVFYEDLATMPGNVADKTCVMIWSEFSRRVQQNENGTDHGSQGPMFIVGGAVNGGVYGNHPNIAAAARDAQGNTVYTQDANPFRSTDFRDVYGTLLKHWLGMPEATIAANVLPPDAGDPAYHWTAANFDLPFLP